MQFQIHGVPSRVNVAMMSVSEGDCRMIFGVNRREGKSNLLAFVCTIVRKKVFVEKCLLHNVVHMYLGQ
jgi:hypothetical protein